MRPFVLVNVAASLDGKISDENRRQLRISCERDFKRVDELRAKSDAIIVGIGTVLADNPSLMVKNQDLRIKRLRLGKSENPTRVVVDSRCRIPLDSKVLDGKAKTIVAVSRRADKSKVELLRDKNVEVVVFGENRVDLRALLKFLYSRKVRKVMVEGGGTLINSFVSERLIDEIHIYYRPILIGGKTSPTVVDGKSFDKFVELELISVERFGDGILVRCRLK